MNKLWLTYVDQDGSDQRVAVDKDVFIIGRHTDVDLCYPDDRLSREHVRIERVDEEFIASDCGSTNGTRLNGEDLFEPTAIRDGDELTLGDRLSLSIRLAKLQE